MNGEKVDNVERVNRDYGGNEVGWMSSEGEHE